MSFYGSIYYQLIDAFYKVVLRNKGKNSKEFCPDLGEEDSFETYAAGRKSVFGFDTGNRWINLNEKNVTNEEAHENYSIYEIYHGAPDPEAENLGHGFQLQLPEGERIRDRISEDENGNEIIQLNFSDIFDTYENVYDNAGHLSKTEHKMYKLPIAEVNEEVQQLEYFVGEPTEGREENPLTTDIKNDFEYTIPTKKLYDYAEENYDHIKTLESYIGDWRDIINQTEGEEKILPPTLPKVIGNIDLMHGGAERTTFAKIIGDDPDYANLSLLYEKINRKQPISLIEAIIREKESLDELDQKLISHQDASNGYFASIEARIGSPLDGVGDSVYDHIAEDREKFNEIIGEPINTDKNIYNHITTLYDNLNWPDQQTGQQKITVSGEIDRLDKKIGDIPEGKTSMSIYVSGEFDRLDKKIGDIPQGETSMRTYVDNVFEDIDEIFTTDLGENYSTSTAFELIKNNADSISSVNDFIGNVEEPNDDSLTKQIENLQSFVGGTKLENDTSLKSHITSLEELIGQTSLKDEESNLITRINNLETTMGENDEFTDTVVDSILTLNSNVSTINDSIGTPEDVKDTLYGEINTANNSITKLITLIGDNELDSNETNLITQLSNIHKTLYIDDNEKQEECLITQVNNIKTSISDIQDSIGNIAEDLASHDFGEGIAVESITDVLNNILTRLKTLEDKVIVLESKHETSNESGEQEPVV